MVDVEVLTPDGFPLTLDNPFADVHCLLSRYFGKYPEPSYNTSETRPAWERAAREIIPTDREGQLDFLCASIERLVWLTEQAGMDESTYHAWVTGRLRNFPGMLGIAISVLGETPLLYDAGEAEMLARQVVSLFEWDMSEASRGVPGYRLPSLQFPVEVIVRQYEWFYKTQSPTPDLRKALAYISEVLKSSTLDGKNRSKFAARIDCLLGHNQRPDAGEAWADDAIAQMDAMLPGEQSGWSAVFSHAGTAIGAKPNIKWQAEAERNRQAVGVDEFRRHVVRWLNLASPPPPFTEAAPRLPDLNGVRGRLIDSPEYQTYVKAHEAYYARVRDYLACISEKNNTILKGLAWYAAASDSTELARALAHLTEAAFSNVRERGAWAKSTGNAAIWALGTMTCAETAVGQLAALRTKLRDRGALKLIESSIASAAEKAGMSVNDLEDLAVPTGGLGTDGTRQETFGEAGSATLTLDAKNAKTKLAWFGPDGKPRKAVPAGVKRDFASEVKALKAADEEIRQALGAQAARLDRALLDERTWTYGVWRERFLAHPILGNLARRLIWVFGDQVGLPLGNAILDADGQEFAPPADDAPVRLWHPLGSPPQIVLRWRDALEARGIVQPFKQAHREVYLLTDAERATNTYSNRFAAHILKQHQFNSLCVLRGWKNKLRLMVDDTYPPATRELPWYNLRAEFWVEGIGDDYGTDTNETGTYLRLVTDQVRFYALDAPENLAYAGGGGYGAGWRAAPAEPLPLEQIPPLAFSEIMRDIDLFVGVASVGNDPAWADGGPQGRFRTYWQDYAFGELTESAKTRADVLGRLLPRLKIVERCHLDARFLVVRGDLRTYKIHLGSGNILMEPNDQYLCIVPKSGDDAGELFLPFEGDRTLAVILSKAFLLAEDARIADPSITRQIKSG